jgi:hypothetical protein
MPALLDKYPGYSGIYELQPAYTHMPAGLIFLYSGQALGQAGIKVNHDPCIFLVS